MCPTSVLSCSVYSQTWVGLLRSVQKTGRVEIRGGGQGGSCRLSEGHVAEWSVPIHGPNRPRRRECPGTPLCLHHGLPPAIEFVLCRVLLPQRHAGLLSPCSWASVGPPSFKNNSSEYNFDFRCFPRLFPCF